MCAPERKVRYLHPVCDSSIVNLLGNSPAMKDVITQLRQVAETDFAVIIQGETGTGKSVVAGVIQSMSSRASRPFLRVDIGLIPDSLVESELFGCRKGAFTGAERDRTGYFEAARGGTLFIDELENMSAHIQARLLSVIDAGELTPLGSTIPVPVDVRIIAATNRDIRGSVKRKEFREDLFYRFGEFIITIPPLRQRPEDIPFFIDRFLCETSAELKRHIPGIEEDAVNLLVRYDWPGNIRELRNVMRKAVLMSESRPVTGECIAALLREKSSELDFSGFSSLRDSVRECEKRIIAQVLAEAGGNKMKAAKLLDISYTGLFAKLREYGIKS